MRQLCSFVKRDLFIIIAKVQQGVCADLCSDGQFVRNLSTPPDSQYGIIQADTIQGFVTIDLPWLYETDGRPPKASGGRPS